MWFMIVLFLVCVFGCRYLFLWVFDSVAGVNKKESESGNLTINETHVHHHYHDNRSIKIGEEEYFSRDKNLR